LFKIDEFDVFYKLKNYQDNIQSVNVTLSLPDTIKVEIGSYKEVFNVVINEKNYILLEN
jgi:cell division septal protein FtsQ